MKENKPRTSAGTAAALWILTALMVHIAGPAKAETTSCGCSPYPLEGIYGDSHTIRISYADGSGEACPTTLNLQGSLRGLPPIATCEGGVWTGVRTEPVAGSIYFALKPVRRVPPGKPAKLAEPLSVALDVTDTIDVEIFLPPALKSIGKRNRAFQVKLRSEMVAPGIPECICQRVRDELEHVTKMNALYSDKEILRVAQSLHARGLNARSDWWMDDSRRLHAFPKGVGIESPSFSYENMIKGIHEGTHEFKNDQFLPVSQEEGAYDDEPDGVAPTRPKKRSYAETQGRTCEIIMPDKRKVQKNCDPSVMIEAAYRHEKHHADRCDKLNNPKEYFAEDGTRIKWNVAVPMHNGIVHPNSGYDAWGQNPANHSKDEAGAYKIEMDMLSEFLANNCAR